jgi:hypothetical protein
MSLELSADTKPQGDDGDNSSVSLLDCLRSAKSLCQTNKGKHVQHLKYTKREHLKLKHIGLMNLDIFPYGPIESVLRGDTVFAKYVQKSAYVICSTGAA